MNIIQKVNNREIKPRHNNYQEVTVDAKGEGPVINFDGVHTRTGGLAGLSPLKHCAATVMHSKAWNGMRTNAYGAGMTSGNKGGIKHAEKLRTSPLNQADHPFRKKKQKKTRKQKLEEKRLRKEFNNLEVPTPPIIPTDTTTTNVSPIKQTWLDNTQKALGAAGWVPGWGALADLSNAAISGGRSLYSLAKGDKEAAKKHGENVLWNMAYAVPGLEYGAKGVKGGTKLYKNLRTTGNPVQSFRKNPVRSSAEAGIGGLVESQTSYEPGSGYNPEMFNRQDIEDAKKYIQPINKALKQGVKDHIKKVESYSIDGKKVNKQEFDDYSKKMESKGDKPNKSWQASDYQKYYDNMKKQKN